MIRVSAPGRICLFGEHQDYLGLPVITMAVDRYIHIEGEAREERILQVSLPDIGGEERFPLPEKGRPLPYRHRRDYLRSVCNVLGEEGLAPGRGARCVVRGTIPINAGTSSSSALCVAWTRFLLTLGGKNDVLADRAQVAHLAWRAEVTAFGGPGGMMDQYASALGGVRFIRFKPEVSTAALPPPPGDFILGDSGEPKDTMAILARVRGGVEAAAETIRRRQGGFSLETAGGRGAREWYSLLSPGQRELLEGALENRDITLQARQLFEQEPFDEKRFGDLLNRHHRVLAGKLRVSTPRIEAMLAAARAAGALGGKINGSGGGGCMFAYAAHDTEKVAAAIEKAGGKAHILRVAT